jgi:hypothetical protein
VCALRFRARDGERLSNGVDEWPISKPVVTRAIVAALALYLANALPVRYDVVSLGSSHGGGGNALMMMRRVLRTWV